MNQEKQKEILEKLDQVEIDLKKTLDKIKTLRKKLKNEVLEKWKKQFLKNKFYNW